MRRALQVNGSGAAGIGAASYGFMSRGVHGCAARACARCCRHEVPDFRPQARATPTFASIVCGINGSRPSFEAARQAALLADPGAGVTYVAVSWEQGTGANAQATLSHAQATLSQAHARDCRRRGAEARELGVDPGIHRRARRGPHAPPDGARRRAGPPVVGIPGHSRAGGIIIGSTATALVHRSALPVLVARRPPRGSDSRSRIPLRATGRAAVGGCDDADRADRRPARSARRDRRRARPRSPLPARTRRARDADHRGDRRRAARAPGARSPGPRRRGRRTGLRRLARGHRLPQPHRPAGASERLGADRPRCPVLGPRGPLGARGLTDLRVRPRSAAARPARASRQWS